MPPAFLPTLGAPAKNSSSSGDETPGCFASASANELRDARTNAGPKADFSPARTRFFPLSGQTATLIHRSSYISNQPDFGSRETPYRAERCIEVEMSRERALCVRCCARLTYKERRGIRGNTLSIFLQPIARRLTQNALSRLSNSG